MAEASAAHGQTTLRAQLASGGFILLVLGALAYLFYTRFLCFDYCGAAEEYANRVLQAAAATFGPGALLTCAAVVLFLRELRQTGRARAFRLALGGAILVLLTAALYIWSGGTRIGQTSGALSPSEFDPVTANLPWRILFVAFVFGVIAAALAWPTIAPRPAGPHQNGADSPGDQTAPT